MSLFVIKILSLLALGLAAVQLPAADYQLEEVAGGLEKPWSIAFLPGGDMLVTEQPGRLRRLYSDGRVSEPIDGVPEVYFAQQGGLFDVVLHPDFGSNRLIYLSYAEGELGDNGTAVARARLGEGQLENVEVIFRVAHRKYAPVHYGGRLVVLPDRTLLLTTGDGFELREQAQNLESQLGKTLRMNLDGSPPGDNPFPAAPYVWTYGHRNPQGLIVAGDGRVILHEHAARGGDEVNLLRPGSNYGWPAITRGVDYSGAHISPFTERQGMEQPVHVWDPSIAPSGFAIYESELFLHWQGSLFVGALVDKEVRRLEMESGQVVHEEALFGELEERIRDVRVGPDGAIYILTDNPEGRVIRVVPAPS